MSLLEKRKFDGEAFGDVPSQQADSTGSLLDGEAEYAGILGVGGLMMQD